jgi:hypothetical protein
MEQKKILKHSGTLEKVSQKIKIENMSMDENPIEKLFDKFVLSNYLL